MIKQDKHTAPAAIWATPTRATYDNPDWSRGEYYDEYGSAGMGTKYVRSDIAALTPEALSFIYALLGADTWLEAGAVWDRNPDQRKAARAAIAKATGVA